MLNPTNTITLGVVFVLWAFAVWGVVLARKSVATVALPGGRIEAVWHRVKKTSGFVVGALSGVFVVPLALTLVGVPLPEDRLMLMALVATGALFGFGAGAVASQAHDLVLWKIDDWVRGTRR